MTQTDYISSLAKPPFAMSFGGVYFETVISGYRTLTVEGRETRDTEITELERLGDGALYQRKRDKSRTIRVKFLIKSTSESALRTQLNKLDGYLYQEQVQIIFDDENDKYYTGTKASATYDLSGKYAAVGELSIYCADPNKYSLTEYEVTASNGEFALNYDGTARSYPVFEADVGSDLGYVSFIDSNKHVIQIGDPDEEDTAGGDYKTTLINEAFTSGSLSGWTYNAATLETEVSSYVQSGSIAISENKGIIATYDDSATSTATRNGPSMTKTCTASANFDLTFDLKMFGTSVKQIQEVMVICTGKQTGSNTKTVLCSMHITHSTDGSYKSSIYSYVMGDKKNQTIWTAEQGNQTFGNYGHCRIRKEGNGFTFMVNNMTTCALKSVGAEDYSLTEVSIFFDRLKNKPHMRSDVGSICTIKNFRLVTFGSTWVDVPNKFSNGDVIIADCSSGEISLNGAVQYGLGALGNDWEKFYLTPGVNSIKCVYSSWDNIPSPTFKMRYRKVYL